MYRMCTYGEIELVRELSEDEPLITFT